MTAHKKSWLQRITEMEPVVLRGAIISVIGLAGMILNFQLAEGQVEAIVSGIISVLAMASALWSRKAVTPNKKVINYKPSPDKRPTEVLPGDTEGR